MMLLPSTSSPDAIRSSTSRERDGLDGHRRLFGAHRGALALLEVGGEEHVGVLVGEPGRVVELAQQPETAGAAPDLLLELTRRGDLGRLTGDVALPAGHLEQVAARGDAVLAHEQRVAVGVDRHHDHRTGMHHDVAVELVAVGPGDAAALDGEEPGFAEGGAFDDAEHLGSGRGSALRCRHGTGYRAAVRSPTSSASVASIDRQSRDAVLRRARARHARTPRTAGAAGRDGS